MKKLFCMMLVALLACMPMLASAEEAIDENVVSDQEAEVEALAEDDDESEEEEAIEEEDDPFTGAWVCDSASIYVDKEEDAYSVFVLWEFSDSEESIWEYACKLDDVTGALVGVGSRVNETSDEEGEVISGDSVYTDGTATFALDGEALIWTDEKEGVAEGMRFEKENSDEPLVDAEGVVEEAEEDAEEASEEAEEAEEAAGN
ncbi:MAG: hypothetical protein E7337_11310 [Clostridiales bacterium]|nr:hypothetical protein [Clostridiales bacterium]